MILVLFFVSVFLSCLPLFHSATYHNTSMPLCPESFSCPDLAPFNYPFYNATNTRCGLIKVHCSSNGNQIQLGNHTYPIAARLGRHRVFIRNTTFQKLIENRSSEALENNFTSPTPLLFSISIKPLMTVYKCTNHSNYAAQTFFDLHNYSSYRCKDHKFYYKYSLDYTQAPSDLLKYTCQVIQLPVKFTEEKLNHTNIFSLLSWNISLSFKLSPSCYKCNKRSGQCATSNQQFQCLDAKKENTHTNRRLILVLAGSAFILMLSSVIFVIWRCRKSSPFSYVSSKEKYPDVEDGSHFFGVSVFSYDELKDATQNFDPSMELGDGGFGAVYYGENFTYLLSHANILREQNNGFQITTKRKTFIYKLFPGKSVAKG